MFVSLFVCGCGAVTLQTELNSAGQVRCTLDISLSGLTNPQRKNLYELLVKYSDSLYNAYEENLITLYGNVYNYEELNLDTPQKQFNYVITQNTKFLTSDNFEIEPKKNWATPNDFSSYENFSIQMSFASIYGYIMFFCPKTFTYDLSSNAVVIDRDVYTSLSDTPVSVLDYETVEKTFTVTYLETCAPFYYNLQEPYLVEDIQISSKVEKYSASEKLVDVVCDLLGVDSKDAEYIFGFSTPYERLHADGTKNDDGTYVWNFGNNISGTVQLWRTIANQAPWYIISLACGILTFVIGGIVCVVVKRKKTKKGMTALQNIQQFVKINDVNADEDQNIFQNNKDISKNNEEINFSVENNKNDDEDVEKNEILQENWGNGELHDEVQKALGEKEKKLTNKRTRTTKKSKKIEKE